MFLCKTLLFFLFFSGVLFVETETLPQKCAESPGNSPGGRRKTALTQRAGTSTGAHPRGSGLPLGLVWNQSISPIPGIPQATDAHKQVNGTYLLKPRGTQRCFRIKFNSYRVIFGCGRDFSIERGVKINHLSPELPVGFLLADIKLILRYQTFSTVAQALLRMFCFKVFVVLLTYTQLGSLPVDASILLGSGCGEKIELFQLNGMPIFPVLFQR